MIGYPVGEADLFRWATRLVGVLSAIMELRPTILTAWVRQAGSTAHLRFTASAVTHFVRVHVQADAHPDYSPEAALDIQTIDCRTSRQQDVEIPLADSARYVWLIPQVELVPYDGEGAPDAMAFVDLGG